VQHDGDLEVAQPFLSAGLIDRVIVHLASPDEAPTPSIDAPLHPSVPSGFTITGISRTPDGVRLEATRETIER
jgi:hypothetical protein